MAKTLEGITVLDWTVFQQGPIASMLLADMGANVIKIEERVGGDLGRGMMRVANAVATAELGRRNFYFELCNRNKRSLTVDLTKARGREIIHGLVAKSDVFVHNFRNETVAKLGMDYATLAAHNPRLVYAGCNGWGPFGPDSDAPGFDFAAMSRSGFLDMIDEPGRQPWFPHAALADQMGAICTSLGVAAALVHRDRTGEGQEVNTSILGGISYLVHMPLGFDAMTNGGIRNQWIDRKKTGNPLYNYYLCKDNRWIGLTLVTPDARWPNLCRAMGLEQYEKDPRFTDIVKRQENAEQLIVILDERFATKTSEEWDRLFRENDLIYSVVNTMHEYTHDPQAVANSYVVEYEHPMWGKTRMPGFPIVFRKTPCSIDRPAPELGQHTEEVLMEMLGYTWDDIAVLKDQEVI